MPGNVVIINGTSSAGKTSIARALQAIVETPYLRIGVDEFLPCLPDGLVQISDDATAAPSTYVTLLYRHAPTDRSRIAPGDPPSSGRLLTGIRIGPDGLHLFAAMYHAMAAMAHQGVDLIVDSLIHEPRELREAVLAFRELPVLLVGLRAPREVVERRERERGDRMPGLAGAFYDATHAQALYDLEFDTSRATAMECALQIKLALAGGHPRTALRSLLESLAGDDWRRAAD